MKYPTDEFQLCFCFSMAKYFFTSTMVWVKEKRLCLGWHLIKLYIKDYTQNAEWALFFVINPSSKKKVLNKVNKNKTDWATTHFHSLRLFFINNSGVVVVVTLIGCCLHVSCRIMQETSSHITICFGFRIRGEGKSHLHIKCI